MSTKIPGPPPLSLIANVAAFCRGLESATKAVEKFSRAAKRVAKERRKK